MTSFPRSEPEIDVLAAEMIAGYAAHAVDFPSADAIGLTAAKAGYDTAKTSQTDAVGVGQIATVTKNAELTSLEEFMKTELKKSELDVAADPEKLTLIGWGPKQPATPIDPPAQPDNFNAALQGPGNVILDWKRPSAPGGETRDYIVERRDEPAGGGEFGEWSLVATTLERELELLDQPRGIQMEYRVKARNLGGESPASNIVAVVL